MNLDTLTIDQLRLFVTVVEVGSFSATARRMRRAQSAVSYGIAKLEEALDLALFDRSGHRPVITEAGRALLHEARAVLRGIDQLGERARAAGEGLEAELSLAVDTLCPTPLIIATARRFHAEFPTVALRLRSELLETVPQLVADGSCDLGLSCLPGSGAADIEARALAQIPMVTVAAASHPLSAVEGWLSGEQVADHMQVVVSQRGQHHNVNDHGVLARNPWRVADAGTKRDLIVAGLGWGNLPLSMVRDELASGQLKRLRLAVFGDRPIMVPLLAITDRDRVPGQALAWLLEALPGLCQAEPGLMTDDPATRV